MIVRIQVRRGTSAQWTDINPVLSSGEFGYETDTGNIKIGNGTSLWSALVYLQGSGADGDSAYEIAVLNGFIGTEMEWLESLEGPIGPQGIQGLTGDTGPQGSQGIQGLTGATGPEGPQGIQGVQGDPGLNGKTVLSGAVDPTSEGVDGDFYINTISSTIFGPKATGVWGSGTSLVGPQGPQGETGLTGPTGPQGIQGIQGIQGETGPAGSDATATTDASELITGTLPPERIGDDSILESKLDPDVQTKINLSSESGESIFFLEDQNDSVIAGYKVMDNPAQLEVKAFVTQSTIVDGGIVQEWITDIGHPGVTFIPAGPYLFKINAFKTGGSAEVRLYNEIYKRTSGGVETLLATTGNSIALTETEVDLPLFNTYVDALTVLESDRLVKKTRMRIIGGGSVPTSITLAYSGDTAARLSLPGQAIDITKLVRVTGDQTIQGIKTFESSPIIPAPTTDLQASTKKYVDDKTTPIDSTGSEIVFDILRTYGSFETPITVTTLTDSGTAKLVQRIFHQAASFTPPANWKKIDDGVTYDPAKINVITVEYFSSTNKTYSISHYA